MDQGQGSFENVRRSMLHNAWMESVGKGAPTGLSGTFGRGSLNATKISNPPSFMRSGGEGAAPGGPGGDYPKLF